MCIVYLNTAVYILMQEVVLFNFCMGKQMSTYLTFFHFQENYSDLLLLFLCRFPPSCHSGHEGGVQQKPLP